MLGIRDGECLCDVISYIPRVDHADIVTILPLSLENALNSLHLSLVLRSPYCTSLVSAIAMRFASRRNHVLSARNGLDLPAVRHQATGFGPKKGGMIQVSQSLRILRSYIS